MWRRTAIITPISHIITDPEGSKITTYFGGFHWKIMIADF